ncbi:spermatogenesis-defective protein 39 homolog [Cylas formicarius]|uniref:spermatogenesis-defective protein 39 homolog n=1 Tax=Cylas formicarius TaxID=197179 RepID=UPI0029588B2C|nr:spermatogenesis-defective protein 39 homolog [Cylas formicarius]
MSKSEDEFWNSSNHSGFNFDDEEDTAQVIDDFVFHSSAEDNSEFPIHAVISKNCLDLVLDDIQSTVDIAVPPVDETIKKMVNGHKYTLHVYIKFQDKMKLLDQALDTYDGDVIIKVILHLKNNLTPNIFYHQLSKRKIAIKHFGYYLMSHNKFDELADLYMATGNTSKMKELYYLTGYGINSKEILYKKLDQFMMQHLQKLNSNDDKLELYENMQLIQYQIKKNCGANSVVEQLAKLCKSEISSQNYLEKLQEFKKNFKIDDFTFEWVLMNCLASMKLWSHLSDAFIKTNWLTKKNVLKTVINSDVLFHGLSRHNPPKDVLEQYLSCISDTDKALFLAQKFQCHNFVILHYVSQRDRVALTNYKEKILPQTTEYFLIESSLQSTDKKWKN